MNKITAFFAVLTLAAAALATQSAAAAGSYRIGWNAHNGLDFPFIGAVVNLDSSTVVVAAEAECEAQRAAGPGGSTATSDRIPKCAQDAHETLNAANKNPRFPMHNVDNECIVGVISTDTQGTFDDVGVGIAANCVLARQDAVANCDDCNENPDFAPLNTAGALYLIDGEATACPLGQFDDSTNNLDALNCQPAMSPEDCAKNDPDFPNNDAPGSCIEPFDPNSCGENEYADTTNETCEPCSDLNREGGVAGAECGACQGHYSTSADAGPTSRPAADAAGNHSACVPSTNLCGSVGLIANSDNDCEACPTGLKPDQGNQGTPNDECVFNPDSCGENEYADTTDEMCESCGDINRQAGAAGADCGACVANYMHADATGGEGDACVFNPDSCDANQYATDSECMSCGEINRIAAAATGANCGACEEFHTSETNADSDGNTACTFSAALCIGMAQFAPAAAAPTECGTCATLNREGADGTSCGACLTNFEHATENDGGISECTAIDDGGEFGVVLPMLDSENISGQGTTEIPYTVPSDSDSVQAFSIPLAPAIANGSGNYSYSVDESSSSQLTIDANGVVSFTAANVGTATYSIIIEITDIATSETTTVTIVVAVAEETVRCEGGTVTGGVCNCPSGTTENQAGVCETDTATPACTGGTVIDGECVCPTNTRLNNGRCRTITGDGSTFPVVIPPVDNGKNRDIVALAHGALGVVVISYLFYSNILLDLTWSPAYSFSNNNGNTFYSVGSRWQATSDNWGFYWQTTGDNNQDFVYSSGVRYNNGIFAAAYDGKTDQTETDMQANVSAYKNVGDYNFAAAYYLDAVVDKKKSEIDNRFDLSAAINWQPWRLSAAMSTDGKERQRLNLIANYTIEKWILSATANTNGKSTTTKINYSYRF